MKSLLLKSNLAVAAVFDQYPKGIREKMNQLRELVFETAGEIEEIKELEETLKWGEPSYLVKKGSTIRMDWKKKNPHQYALYFKCTSLLVPAFKKVYPNTFKYEGNRAIIFPLGSTIPTTELKSCIAAALRYHSLKNTRLLGM